MGICKKLPRSGWLASLVFLLILGQFTNLPAAEQSASRVVFVSIPPQAFLVNGIAGDLVTVEVLLPPGHSPHTFEPTARQMIQLARADLYFSIGLPFEQTLRQRYQQALVHLRIVDTRTGLHLLTIHGADEPADFNPSLGTASSVDLDPHVWMSPLNMKIMARTIADSLCGVYPDHAEDLRAGLQNLLAQLDSADAEVRALLDPYRGRRMYVFHPAYGYFAHDYGLQEIAIEDEGKEPSAHRLAELLDEISNRPVAALCVQPEFSAKEVDAVARELHTSVLRLDPLARDYTANLVSIAQQLAAAYAQVSAK